MTEFSKSIYLYQLTAMYRACAAPRADRCDACMDQQWSLSSGKQKGVGIGWCFPTPGSQGRATEWRIPKMELHVHACLSKQAAAAGELGACGAEG